MLCVVFCGPARSQTIGLDEALAPVGSNFQLYGISEVFPWDTLEGNGVLWDYDWTLVDSTSEKSISIIPTSAAPDATSYPDADRVERSVTGGDYVIDRFYDVGTDRVRELGSVGPVLSYVFDDPETHPMQLGDTSFGDYCVWSDGLGSQYHFCGGSYVTFDATGTLVLPYGTFTDVKHVTRWHQSITTSLPESDTTIVIRQQWFLPSIPFPVLDVVVYYYADGLISPSGWLMDGATITAIREEEAQFQWSISPIPTVGPFTVTSDLARAAQVEILSLDGRVVTVQQLPPGPTRHHFSLSELPDGMYLVRMSSEDRTSTQRIVKASNN